MKGYFLNFSRLPIVILFLFLACNKSSDSQNDSGAFTWTWNGTNYIANFKEAFLQSLSANPLIIGGTGTVVYSAGTGPRISVNSLNVGSYNLGSGLPNYILFIAPNGDNLNSTVGTLNTTLNSNGKLSGNFSATLINGVGQTSSLNGSFSNINISQ